MIRVLWFAWLRERVGVAEEELAPPAGVGDVGGLVGWLATLDERHAAALARPELVRCAVNRVFAAATDPVRAGDEVALFPPVTGAEVAVARVQSGPFDLAAELAAMAVPGVGGIGCFVGVVRGGGGLAALELEHYPGMTERQLCEIAAEAERRWALLACAVVHRVGCLAVGEGVVLVLAAAAHRAAALDATAFLIDWLKTQAPFWKREWFEDGTTRWVDAREADDAAAARWSLPT